MCARAVIGARCNAGRGRGFDGIENRVPERAPGIMTIWSVLAAHFFVYIRSDRIGGWNWCRGEENKSCALNWIRVHFHAPFIAPSGLDSILFDLYGYFLRFRDVCVRVFCVFLTKNVGFRVFHTSDGQGQERVWIEWNWKPCEPNQICFQYKRQRIFTTRNVIINNNSNIL